jgi:hypothetical protein
MGLLIYESIRANPKIKAMAKKLNPECKFIRKSTISMYFSSNSFWVDRKHPNCTPEVLEEWDTVYGVHWRRIIAGFVMLPVISLFAQFLRHLLLKTIT